MMLLNSSISSITSRAGSARRQPAAAPPKQQQHRLVVATAPPPPRLVSSVAAAAAAAASPSSPPSPSPPPAAPESPAPSSTPSVKWWEKKPARGTFLEINSGQDFVDILADAGDRLVVLDIMAPFCGACRGVAPKVLGFVEQYAGEGPPDPTAPGQAPEDGVIFVKLNFDANRKLGKTLGVRVLPYFMFFRGAEGRVAAFSCTTSKISRLRDALDFFSAGVCSLEPNPEVQELSRGWDIHPSHPADATRVEHYWDLDEAVPIEQSVLEAPTAAMPDSAASSGASTPLTPASPQ
jgi:thiol-disulfide isomerase/thioredoxin